MHRITTFLRWMSIALLGMGLVVASGRAAVWVTSSEITPGLSRPAEVYTWAGNLPGFGGYSGLIISSNGQDMLTSSDRGHFITAGIKRRPAGQIEGIEVQFQTPLLLHTGIQTDQFQSDLEGLAPLSNGTIALSFESYTRLQIMQPITGTTMQLPRSTHPWNQFEPQFNNLAFEAITALPARTDIPTQRILAVMEKGTTPSITDAYIYDGALWQGPTPFPRSPGYEVTGADLGPDGCLYILERNYGVFSGFQFQLLRMNPEDWDAKRTVLYRSKPMNLGNGEGVSVWTRVDGLVATIITDNGFPPLSPTRVIELPLAPAPDCAGQ